VGKPQHRRSGRPTELDYSRLARFRYALRRFLRFSETAARNASVSPAQYQLLLFVRAFPGGWPTVADMAERLQVQHQSAVGLIDRCAGAGLIRRQRDAQDRRQVRLRLTAAGSRLLARLVLEHYRGLAELRKAIPRQSSFQVPPR
jgi:DNA-binding MarR family transcriptional regulator